MSVGPQTNAHIGYSEETIASAAEHLSKRGEEGLHWRDLLALVGKSPTDAGAGYLLRAMREHGFLVQMEGNFATILPEALCRKGTWMRHPTRGVVRVAFEKPGFPYVTILQLGEGREHLGQSIRVPRADLSGC